MSSLSNLDRLGGSRSGYHYPTAVGLNATRGVALPFPEQKLLTSRNYLHTPRAPSLNATSITALPFSQQLLAKDRKRRKKSRCQSPRTPPKIISARLPQSDAPRSRKRRAETSESELVNRIHGAGEIAAVQRVTQSVNEPEPVHNWAERAAPGVQHLAMQRFRAFLHLIASVPEMVTNMRKQFVRYMREVPEIAAEPYEIVENRQFNPATNHVIVKRLKRQHCIPVLDPEPHTTPDILTYYEWTDDPCYTVTIKQPLEKRLKLVHREGNRAAARELLDRVIDPLKFHIKLIEEGQIHYDMSVIDQEAELGEEAGHERDLSAAIHSLVNEFYEEHSQENFDEAANEYLIGAKDAVLMMKFLYLNDSLLSGLKEKYPKPPRCLRLVDQLGYYGNEGEHSMLVKRAADFIQWITHREVFNIHGNHLETLCRILMDVKAVHKNEVPPSLVDFSELRKPDYPRKETMQPKQQGCPGAYPKDENELDDDENPIEYLQMSRFTVKPKYELLHPASPAATNQPHHDRRELSYTHGRLRSIVKQRTEKKDPATPNRKKKTIGFISPVGHFRPPNQVPTEPIEDFLPPHSKIRPPPKPRPTTSCFDLNKQQDLWDEEERDETQVDMDLKEKKKQRLAERAAYDRTRRSEVLRGEGLYSQNEEAQMAAEETDWVPDVQQTAHRGVDRQDRQNETAAEHETPTRQIRGVHNEVSPNGETSSHDGTSDQNDASAQLLFAQLESSPRVGEEEKEDLYTPEAQLLREAAEAREREVKLKVLREKEEKARRARIEALMVRSRRRPRHDFGDQQDGGSDARQPEDGSTTPRPRAKPSSAESITARLDQFFLEDDDDLFVSAGRGDDQDSSFQVSLDVAEFARQQEEKRAQEALRKLEEERRLKEERERIRRENERRRAAEAKEADRRRRAAAYAKDTGLRAPGRQILAPLSEEWEAKIEQATHAAPNKGLVQMLDGSELHRADFTDRLLGGMDWLNDNIIIGSVMNLAAAINEKAGKTSCVAMTSFFWPRLHSHGLTSCGRLQRRAGIKKDTLLDIDTILIPICEGSHWTLAVVRPKRRAVAHMDSFRGGGSHPEKVAILLKWVKEGVLEELFIEEEWKEEKYHCPTQRNGWDCGVFTIMNGIAMALGVDASAAYSADQLRAMRRQLAAALLNKGFSGDLALTGI